MEGPAEGPAEGPTNWPRLRTGWRSPERSAAPTADRAVRCGHWTGRTAGGCRGRATREACRPPGAGHAAERRNRPAAARGGHCARTGHDGRRGASAADSAVPGEAVGTAARSGRPEGLEEPEEPEGRAGRAGSWAEAPPRPSTSSPPAMAPRMPEVPKAPRATEVGEAAEAPGTPPGMPKVPQATPGAPPVRHPARTAPGLRRTSRPATARRARSRPRAPPWFPAPHGLRTRVRVRIPPPRRPRRPVHGRRGVRPGDSPDVCSQRSTVRRSEADCSGAVLTLQSRMTT